MALPSTLVAVAAMMAACSDAIAPTRRPSPAPNGAKTSDSEWVCCGRSVTVVQVDPAPVQLAPGADAALTATLRAYLQGPALDPAEPGRLVVWSSSDTNVVTVASTGRATARVTGLRAGTATITAYVQKRRTLVTVTVAGTPAAIAPIAPVDTVPNALRPAPPSTAPGATHAGYYVAPTGSAAGTGAADKPWDLATALAQPAAVQAGDTIWVRGGTYRGQFTSRLAGSAKAPIVVRQYPGERATVDGNLVVLGSSTVYWGLEVMSSNRARPAVVGVNVKGPRTRFVNMVVHDAGDNGFGFWSEAPDAEIYGSLIYNNGRMIATRGAAHGIYSQNATGTKRIVDNVLFNQFAYGIHVYGSEAAALRNYHIEGNASFNNGTAAQGGSAPDLLVGGGSAASGITVARNYTYRSDAGTTAVFGYLWGPANADLALTNNYFVGSTNILKWNAIAASGNTFAGAQTLLMLTMPEGVGFGSYAWRGNEYRPAAGQWQPFNLTRGGTVGLDLAGWQKATGLDQASALLARGRPTGQQVFVRPNQYEPGRAHVIVYNWDRAGTASVNASGFLAPGTRYEVRAAQDFYGAPVASGTYAGGAITIPIGAVAPPTPIGGPVTPVGTGVDFNVYVIVPVR